MSDPHDHAIARAHARRRKRQENAALAKEREKAFYRFVLHQDLVPALDYTDTTLDTTPDPTLSILKQMALRLLPANRLRRPTPRNQQRARPRLL
jgi:hypothetical protein